MHTYTQRSDIFSVWVEKKIFGFMRGLNNDIFEQELKRVSAAERVCAVALRVCNHGWLVRCTCDTVSQPPVVAETRAQERITQSEHMWLWCLRKAVKSFADFLIGDAQAYICDRNCRSKTDNEPAEEMER